MVSHPVCKSVAAYPTVYMVYEWPGRVDPRVHSPKALILCMLSSVQTYTIVHSAPKEMQINILIHPFFLLILGHR